MARCASSLFCVVVIFASLVVLLIENLRRKLDASDYKSLFKSSAIIFA